MRSQESVKRMSAEEYNELTYSEQRVLEGKTPIAETKYAFPARGGGGGRLAQIRVPPSSSNSKAGISARLAGFFGNIDLTGAKKLAGAVGGGISAYAKGVGSLAVKMYNDPKETSKKAFTSARDYTVKSSMYGAAVAIMLYSAWYVAFSLVLLVTVSFPLIVRWANIHYYKSTWSVRKEAVAANKGDASVSGQNLGNENDDVFSLKIGNIGDDAISASIDKQSDVLWKNFMLRFVVCATYICLDPLLKVLVAVSPVAAIAQIPLVLEIGLLSLICYFTVCNIIWAAEEGNKFFNEKANMFGSPTQKIAKALAVLPNKMMLSLMYRKFSLDSLSLFAFMPMAPAFTSSALTAAALVLSVYYGKELINIAYNCAHYQGVVTSVEACEGGYKVGYVCEPEESVILKRGFLAAGQDRERSFVSLIDYAAAKAAGNFSAFNKKVEESKGDEGSKFGASGGIPVSSI